MVPMSESKLRDMSLDFAVSIINLVKELKLKKENIISNQIGRSGTSIGANIRENLGQDGFERSKPIVSCLFSCFMLCLCYNRDKTDNQVISCFCNQSVFQ